MLHSETLRSKSLPRTLKGILPVSGAALFGALAGYSPAALPAGAQVAPSARGAPPAESRQFQIGGATITVNIASGRTDLPAARLYAWVTRAARAVAVYYAGFPVTRAEVNVRPAPGRDGVFHGLTFCQDSGLLTTRISVGEHTTEEDLAEDWMMTHEL